jgi:hypothetical protein
MNNVRKMIQFYCPECDLLFETVCSCCYICSECRTVQDKDNLEKYMKERLRKLSERKQERE